jgi:hypothetical protein
MSAGARGCGTTPISLVCLTARLRRYTIAGRFSYMGARVGQNGEAEAALASPNEGDATCSRCRIDGLGSFSEAPEAAMRPVMLFMDANMFVVGAAIFGMTAAMLRMTAAMLRMTAATFGMSAAISFIGGPMFVMGAVVHDD